MKNGEGRMWFDKLTIYSLSEVSNVFGTESKGNE